MVIFLLLCGANWDHFSVVYISRDHICGCVYTSCSYSIYGSVYRKSYSAKLTIVIMVPDFDIKTHSDLHYCIGYVLFQTVCF